MDLKDEISDTKVVLERLSGRIKHYNHIFETLPCDVHRHDIEGIKKVIGEYSNLDYDDLQERIDEVEAYIDRMEGSRKGGRVITETVITWSSMVISIITLILLAVKTFR